MTRSDARIGILRVLLDAGDDFRRRCRVKETSDLCFDDFIESETSNCLLSIVLVNTHSLLLHLCRFRARFCAIVLRLYPRLSEDFER
ncbi:hypothetical protein H5410_025893 [Solanum commersonii]|uniref:Uncharacterized protein n=1 Tax=Solanum commersonii TaxID=4109 RepID=A0A9J5YV09_SOLCO|nr:hypothetical protein H5410_025893 [Solanum commersonii]